MVDPFKDPKLAEELYTGFQDHPTFCRESLIVETEGRQLVPMELGPGQILLEDTIQRQRRAGRPVRIIYLKSRRIQATTGTAARFFHDTAFHSGVHTVVLAHDDTSVQNIFSIYERFHNKYKPFRGVFKMMPSRPLSDRIYFASKDLTTGQVDDESSFIQIHTAGTTSFGRSFRITNVHFSEFPYYPDPGATLAAVMSAVPKLPDTTAIVEGTARTIGDYFQRMWQQAMDGQSEWEGIFLGWADHPSNRMPLPIGADRFQNSLTKEEIELRGRYSLNLEQLYWRRWTIANDFNGDLIRFHREHPITPEEAFTASSRVRFSIPHIQRMPVQAQCLVGDLVEEDFGIEKQIVFVANETGRLKIWKRPETGRFYAAGADPAGGSDANGGQGEADPDWAVNHIFDRDTGEQVATFRARIWPGAFGKYLYLLLRWYNNAQVCVERTGAGIGTLEALLERGYPGGLIYHRPVTPDQDPSVRSDKIGWNTDEVSRQQALSLLDEAIRMSSITVHDPATQRELLTFVLNRKGKPEAETGCHDDTVMALAFAVVAMARMPKPAPPKSQVRPVVAKYGRHVESQDRGRPVRLR